MVLGCLAGRNPEEEEDAICITHPRRQFLLLSSLFIIYVGLTIGWTTLTKASTLSSPDITIVIIVACLGTCLLTLFAWRVQDGSFLELGKLLVSEWLVTLKYALLGLCFVSTDYLCMDFVQRTNPSTFHMLMNLRTCITVLIWERMMGTMLSPIQWLSMFCIIVGCTIKESNSFIAASHVDSQRMSAFGELILLFIIGAGANVYNEAALKVHKTAPLNYQNLLLYAFCVIWAILFGLVKGAPVFSKAEWLKLSHPVVMLLVTVIAVLGVFSTRVLKRLSNITKEVANGVQVIVVVNTDFLFFGAPLGAFEIAGAVLTAIGVITYAYRPVDARPATAQTPASATSSEETTPLKVGNVRRNNIWGRHGTSGLKASVHSPWEAA